MTDLENIINDPNFCLKVLLTDFAKAIGTRAETVKIWFKGWQFGRCVNTNVFTKDTVVTFDNMTYRRMRDFLASRDRSTGRSNYSVGFKQLTLKKLKKLKKS